MKFHKIILSIAMALLAIILIKDASAIAQGIQKGLDITYQTLIPSLFPFMILSGFIVESGLYRILSIPLYPITKYIFRLHPSLGSITLISFIGGFPVGAKNILSLYQSNILEKDTAEKMLAYCVNAGPAFIISGVGGKLLNNPTIGLILFVSQLSASILIGWIVGFFMPKQIVTLPKTSLPYGKSFTLSVQNNVSAMFQISSFVLVFSGIISYLESLSLPDSLFKNTLYSMLEVTSGTLNAGQLSGAASYFFLSLSLSFCGISVIMQISSMLSQSNLSLKYFFLSRIIHCPVAYCISMALIRFFSQETSVFSPSNTIVTGVSQTSTPTFLFLLLTIFSFIFTIQNKLEQKKIQ